MSTKQPTLKYGHTEGLTQVCYDENGRYLISCGFGGEVRIWKGIDDDEPNTITAGEKVFSVAIKDKALFVAPDNNSVDRYTFPDGSQDGILARFTGNVTNLSVSESKKYVAAGSSDFDIKIVITDNKKQKCFLGHQAPILSVALDPMDEFLASTSCDGTLKIWSIDNETCVKTIPVIPSSNDVGNSQTLARICWRPSTGEDIAVPTVVGVTIYARVTWTVFQSLSTNVTTKAFQCCSFSPCGRFIAGASVDGWVVVWDAETKDCLRTIQHPMKSCISSIAWNPLENNSIAFSDTRGQVGVLDDVVPSEQPTKSDIPNDLDALFEEDDDNMMLDLMADEDNGKMNDDELPKMKKKSKMNNLFASDDEVDSMKGMSQDLPAIPSTLEVLGRNDDDLDLAPPTIPPSLPAKLFDDDDASSVATGTGVLPGNRMQPSTTQQPFQPGSTPVHLSHRFMVWNAIGVVRSYNDEVESAIDVEFHDTQTHHALHLDNHDRYTMADLSDKAVVLATEASYDTPSKLKCIHFSSWDNNKEWNINIPESEDIKAITIGDCWLAVCSDNLQVRLFTLGGTQRQIFSIPGPVVAMAAHTDQLLISYHATQGFGKNQCLGYMLLEVGVGSGCRPRKVVGGQPLPVSPGSTLTWMGFTAEGTPVTGDSDGVIRLMNREFCGTWTQVANTRKMTKSRHDHYWVVGLHENPQQIRCILCKGASYPATLPRPTITVQQYCLPLCEMESDKGKYEEEYWRTRLFSSYGDYLTSRGYEADLENKQKSQLEIQHILMRLFAFCCKTEQEFQAHEVCSLMPTTASVNLAIKYASRLRKIALAQRLQEVAQDKLQEEQEAAMKEMRRNAPEEESEDEEEDFRAEMQAGYSATDTEWSSRRSQPTKTLQPMNMDRDEDSDVEVVTSQTEQVEREKKTKPARSLSSQLAGSRKNPFKKTSSATPKPTIPEPNARDSSAPSSGSVLDGLKRSTPTSQRRTPITSKEITKKMKGKDSGKKSKTSQPTLFNKLNLTSTPKPKKLGQRVKEEDDGAEEGILKEKSENNEQARSLTGVQMFIEEKLPSVQEENPDADGIEARKIVIQLFRSLPKSEKQEWNEKAKNMCPTTPSSALKRKRESDESDDVNENSPPTKVESTNQSNPAKNHKLDNSDVTSKIAQSDAKSKLSAFAFTTNQ